MSNDGLLVVAVFGSLLTWTATVAGLAAWLERRFRTIERLIYKEDNKLQKELYSLHTRMYRLELKAFGVTFVHKDGPELSTQLDEEPP